MGPNKKLQIFSSHRHILKYVIQFQGVRLPRSPPLGSAPGRPETTPPSEREPHRAVCFVHTRVLSAQNNERHP